jgi:hypothetical protein
VSTWDPSFSWRGTEVYQARRSPLFWGPLLHLVYEFALANTRLKQPGARGVGF